MCIRDRASAFRSLCSVASRLGVEVGTSRRRQSALEVTIMSEKKAPTPPRDKDDEPITFGDELPVLPIRNAVLFPGNVAPFDVGREKSVALVEDVDNFSSPVIAIFAQKDPSTDDPGAEDLHTVGCAARVLKALKHSSGNYSLILQGIVRIRLEEVTQTGPYLKAKIVRLDEAQTEDDEAEALSMSLRDIAKQVIQLMPELPREAGSLIDSIQALSLIHISEPTRPY